MDDSSYGKLNDDEMIIFISKHNLKLYGVCSRNIGADIISPVDCVRNLQTIIKQKPPKVL